MSCANHEMVVTLEKKNLLSDRVKEAVITITQGKPSGFGMGDRFYMGTKLGDSASDVVCATQSSLGFTGLSEDAELCCTWNSPGRWVTRSVFG